MARVKFTGIGAGGGDEDSASEPERSGDEEEEVRETRRLVAQQNRKGKKSGGFQSMGERPRELTCYAFVTVVLVCRPPQV